MVVLSNNSGPKSSKPVSSQGARNILVTGGAGFIGSWMCQHLIEKYADQGYTVVCLDILGRVSSPNNIKVVQGHPNFHFVQGSINDLETLLRIMREYDIDSVMNFAGESNVEDSFTDPLVFINTNTLGTFTILEAMRVHGKISSFVHVSTDEVYGETWGTSVNEEAPMRPTNPYAASKASGEMLVLAYEKSFKIPAVILRSNNVYGPRQFPEKLIPRFAMLVMHGKKLTVQGDGSQTRNWLYISDTVNAFDTLLHHGVPGEIYNINSADEVSVREVADTTLEAFGRKISEGDLDKWLVTIPDRPYNDKDYIMKGDKIKALGWKQQVSFKQGMMKTAQWYRENGDTWWETNSQN